MSAHRVTKVFGGHVALDNASIEIAPGEVHGLVGANGAGKSTLIKILAGVVRPDHAEIEVDGRQTTIDDERASRALGLRFVHQDLGLVGRLSVAENVFLGSWRRRWFSLGAAVRAARPVLEDFTPVDPKVKCASLPTADQWMVAIARSCDKHARLVVMDEPTVALSDHEVQRVFKAIERLKRSGVSVLLVTHRLNEILQTCDRVTVMRDGRTVGTHDVAGMRQQELVDHIVGEVGVRHRAVRAAPSAKAESRPAILTARGLAGGAVRHVDLDVRAGEILGIGGLVGSGRSSLLAMLFGAQPVAEGTLTLDGKPIRIGSPHHAVRLGFGLIPEDRREQGLLMSRTVRENTVLAHLNLTRWAPRLPAPSKQRETRVAAALASELGVVSRGPETVVGRLSGGNQQKLLFARWLVTKDLRVLLLDEPTKGVDVGAKEDMFDIARKLARNGVAVVLVSSDLEEVAQNSDRVVVLVEGRNVAELAGPCTEGEILDACYAATS